MITARRAVILPVVLLILLLLGLLVAMFSFRVHADVAATKAIAQRLQTRLAAEAGIERVKLLLRDSRFDTDAWYNNPEDLHRIIVWMHDGDETIWGTNDEFDGQEMIFRFSIVADDPFDDEERIRFGLTDESSKVNLNTATERQLIILVRAAVGDSEEIEPREIVNAILDWRDPDSEPRGEDSGTEGEYYRSLPKPYRVRNGPFATVEELLLVKGVTGQVLYGEDFDRNGMITDNEDDGDKTFPPDNQDNVLNRGLYPYLTVLSEEENVGMNNRPRVYLLGDATTVHAELEAVFPESPGLVTYIVSTVQTMMKAGKKNVGPNTGNEDPESDSGSGDTSAPDETDDGDPDAEDPDSQEAGEGGMDDTEESDEDEEESTDESDATKGQGSGTTAILSPASLLRDQFADGRPISSALTMDDLPLLLDRTTTVPPQQRSVPGLININTAPPLVLRCIGGLTAEQIDEIIAVRGSLSSEQKETVAWLLAEEVVDFETFDRIVPLITARGQQFMIESLGYADHLGMVTRLQVVVDVVGPIVQTVYYRDLTELSGHYPIREEDLEQLGIH